MTMDIEAPPDLGLLLRNLLDLELDALESYETAMACAKSDAHRATLGQLRTQHAQHVHELTRRLCEVGGEPPKGPDLKRVLTQSKVALAGLKGDGPLLATLKTGEDDTCASYEQATSAPSVPPPVHDLLCRYLDDERRFASSLAGALALLDAGDDAPRSASH